MPRYLVRATYNAEGVGGLVKEGATARRAVVREMLEGSSPNAMAARFTFTEQNYPAMRTSILEMVEGLNGRLEAFYYALGQINAIAIVDVPDDVSLRPRSSG